MVKIYIKNVVIRLKKVDVLNKLRTLFNNFTFFKDSNKELQS